MNILFTGRGNAGSWQIRGEQLGAAVLGMAQVNASADLIEGADIVVVVKKVSPALVATLRMQQKRWVFDAVDFYPQPVCTHWSKQESIDWVRRQIDELDPTAVVWPNKRMRQDCDDGRPGLVLYHHHRPGLQSVKVRPALRTLAYEGAAPYLGQWKPVLQRVCDAQKVCLFVNPPSMHIADAVIAVRDTPFAGYAQTHWKSNVKLANAQALGAVFIGQEECGYTETCTGAELWVQTPKDLRIALATAADADYRQAMQAKALRGAYSVQQAAKDMGGFLRGL